MAPKNEINLVNYHSTNNNYERVEKKCSISKQKSHKLESNEENEQKFCKFCPKIDFNGKQVVVILLLCYGNFCIGSAYSVLAPFFPVEAQLKGTSETWIGLILAQYQFSILIGSIFFGKTLATLTPKFLLTMGLTVAGVGATFFGFLQWSPIGATFIVLGITLRTIEGLGAAAFYTSCLTLICMQFPDHIPKLMATIEMCFGVGLIFGPTIGGLLNQLGKDHGAAFCLPFFVIGFLAFLGSALIRVRVPKSETIKIVEKTSILRILSQFNVTFNVLIAVNCFLMIGFNEATLELHLETIQELSPSATGGIFIISGLLYAVSNQVWAHFAEKMDNCYPICFIGCMCTSCAYLISGPVPFIPIESKLWLAILGQVFLGLGLGAQFVGSFTQGLRETLKSGFPDNVSTYAAVAGIYSSAYAFGASVGPAIGGYLLGHLGYRWATVPIVGLQLFLCLAIIILSSVKLFTQGKTTHL